MKNAQDVFWNLWIGEDRRSRLAGYLAVFLLALAVRLAAVLYAYPAPGDVVHFVQVGIEVAQGNQEAWQSVWSPGSLLVSTWAARCGLYPAIVLQWLSLVTGVLVPVGFMMAAFRVFGSWRHALITGVFLACNPQLVYYSVGGWSELPYIALLPIVVVVAWRWMSTGNVYYLGSLAAFLALGVGSYFRPSETLVVFVVLVMVGLGWLIMFRQWKKTVPIVAGVILFVLLLLPSYSLNGKAGVSSSASAKQINLVMGEYNYDSKLYGGIQKPWDRDYEELKEKGTLSYMLIHRDAFARRWMRNVARAGRIVNDELFFGTFRMGPGWIALGFLVAAAAAAQRRQIKPWLFCAFFCMVPSVFIALSHIHDRYMLQVLPFVYMLISDVVVRATGLAQTRLIRLVIVALIVLFVLKTSLYAVRLVDETDWPYWNGREVGEVLKAYGSDEETLMTQQYCIALHFHSRYSARLAALPYGSIEAVEQFAAQRGVALLAISDSIFSHWPISQLFRGAAPPANWKLLKKLKFSRETRFGEEEENYLLFRRTPMPSEAGTAAGDSGP